MSLNIDIQRLLEVARMTGALSGNTPQFNAEQLKEASLTASTLLPVYNPGLFDICGSNDLLSLVIENDPFLDWLGWRANNEAKQFVKLLTYVGPAGAYNGTEGNGAAAACDDAAGVEFGTCQVLLPGKGRIKRAGPVRDLTENNVKLCDAQPVYMKNGQPIADELQWSASLAGIAVRQDLMRMVITGNASNANEFSGLQSLVKTGYTDVESSRRCYAMDSIVVNWASHAATYALNGTHVLVDYIIDIVRRIRQRAMAANLGQVAVGDMVLMMPTFLRDDLLNAFTCWSVCPGAAYNEANLNTFEARTFRNTLNGGAFGMGQIFVDGTPIPIITYDWSAISQAAPYFVGDIYLLTRRIGNVPTLSGQYINMTEPAARFTEEVGLAHYKATDGGRFLTYWKTDNECTQATVVMRPNIYLSAPWACARIQNVAALRPLNPLSNDPTSAYFAESNIYPAFDE